MDSKPIFNLDTIIDICGGDKKFISEMIDLFILQSEPQLDEFDLVLGQNDIEKLKKIAHKYKSSALLFDIPSLVELLAMIENTGLVELNKKEKKIILKKLRSISELVCLQLKEIRKNYD
jgi:HPt (histidine-containing phosphotransfer) domain-containing protein